LKRGDCPRLEEYLVSDPAAASVRAALLRELLALEWEYSEKSGQQSVLAEYRARFPNDVELVSQTFREFEQSRRLEHDDGGNDDRSKSRPASDARRGGESPSQQLDSIPQQLGRYEVLRLIADGGFGRVLLAKDLELDRLVALKISRAGLFDSKKDVDRFLKEARMAARLSHPNIVSIYDVGRSDERGCYIVMDYIDGGPVDVEETASRLTVHESVDLVAKVAHAVHHAHTKGLVHRDLKPGNILLDSRGTPYVTDFGLAVHESEQQDHAGEITGTPPYMSPEQVCGLSHRLDGRTDIWSLGVLLYELLTGRKPFQGQTRERVFDEILNRDPKPLRQINDKIPVQLERICLKALSKQPTDRHSTALDFANELIASVDSEDVSLAAPLDVQPADTTERTGVRAFVRDRVWIVALSVCLIAVLSTAVVLGWPWLRGPTHEAQVVSPSPQVSREWMLESLPFEQSLSSRCTRLVFSGERDLLAAVDDSGHVSLLRCDNGGELLRAYSRDHPVLDVGFSQDGTVMAVICSDDRTVHLYSTEHPQDDREMHSNADLGDPRGFAPNPARGGPLAFDGRGKSLAVVDARTGEEYARFDDVKLQGILAASGRQSFVVVGYDRGSRRWFVSGDAAGWSNLDQLGRVYSLDVTLDGTMLAIGCYRPDAGIWVHDGSRLVALNSEDQELLWYHDVAFLHQGKGLVAVSRQLADDTHEGKTVVRVWELDGPRLVIHETIDAGVDSVAFDRSHCWIGLAFETELRLFKVRLKTVAAPS
jgi:serine/threonine protein kinase